MAAAGSPGGGSSAAIALLIGSERYETLVSAEVVREALKNVRLKLDQAAVIRFLVLLGDLRPTLVESGQGEMDLDLPGSVATKDYHVIQACIMAGVSICLSLDRRHLLTEDLRVWGTRRQLRFLTPGEFLAWERLRSQEPGPSQP